MTGSSGHLVGEADDLLDLGGGKEPIHRITAKVGQRRFVEILQFELALIQKHLLNSTQETNLVGAVLVSGDVPGKAPFDHHRVIRQGIQAQNMTEKSEETIDLQAVG